MPDLLLILASLGGIGGIIAAYVSVRKLGVEKTDITIGTADKVMLGQGRFIDDLQTAVDRANNRVDECMTKIAKLNTEVSQMHYQLGQTSRERDALLIERDQLRERVRQLEHKVATLEKQGEGRNAPRS